MVGPRGARLQADDAVAGVQAAGALVRPGGLGLVTLVRVCGARLQADDAVAGVQAAGALARPGGLPQRPAPAHRRHGGLAARARGRALPAQAHLHARGRGVGRARRVLQMPWPVVCLGGGQRRRP
jgi:hypothetical protein